MSASRCGLFCSVLLGLQVLVVPGSAVAAPVSAGSSSSSCTASWTDEPVSGSGLNVNALVSISGTSPTSLYAAGYQPGGSGFTGRLMRNTGSGWTDLTLPGPASAISFLTSSLSTTANTAWVGGSGQPGTFDQAVLLRVVGNTASQVTLPAPPPAYPVFDASPLAIASAGGTDLWVGGGWDSELGETEGLIYHQNGPGSWVTTVIPSGVDGIAAISPSEAYVAGGGLSLISGGTVTHVPQPGDQSLVFTVVARSAHDVWTLGETITGTQIIDHFDGTTWTSVPLPDPAASAFLNAIAVAPNGTLWVTGEAESVVTGQDESTLARFDPASGTWATTYAAAATIAGNLPAGSPSGLVALGSGNVYMVGGGGLAPVPIAAKLCQLPTTLSGETSTVTAATLGDGVLVTSPQGASRSATVSDTTGLLSTGPLHAGQGAALSGLAAGTFTLRTTAGSANATFAVPPTSSTFNYKTTVTIATEAAPAGYVYQVQMMRPGSTTWAATPLSAKSNGVAKYLYSVLYPAGNYLLRARVERLATATEPATSTGWSPPVTAVVEG